MERNPWENCNHPYLFHSLARKNGTLLLTSLRSSLLLLHTFLPAGVMKVVTCIGTRGCVTQPPCKLPHACWQFHEYQPADPLINQPATTLLQLHFEDFLHSTPLLARAC